MTRHARSRARGNLALDTDFLAAHLDEPDVRRDGRLPAAVTRSGGDRRLGLLDADAPTSTRDVGARATEWAASGHAESGVNCSDCHGAAGAWVDRPRHTVCTRCHEDEVKGFLSGRHGMRLAAGLSPQLPPMTPGRARLWR